MKKVLLPVSFSFLMVACKIEQPLDTRRSDNNSTYTVDYLFTHDGCKVYRFCDNGHYVYFTNCTGEAIVRGDSSTVIRNTTRVEPK